MKTTFPELLANNKVVIPILQRDYAQGRTEEKTNRIRKDFLDALFDVIIERTSNTSATPALELDFVYGFSKKEKEVTCFSPIDGQQRLTTLWLLWWFVGAKEQVQEKSALYNFRYETRHSTTVFCEKLLGFRPSFVSNNVTEEIKNQPWYFETWDYDPGIRAMLVMLNDIEQRYLKLDGKPIWSILNDEISPFHFYKLDMEKVGLPDDLYIKMNSRGKPLTDFEYFKANFSENISDEQLKQRFQRSIDREWSETIWKVVCNSKLRKKAIDLALVVDGCFMRLINFITDVLASKEGVVVTDITDASAEVRQIYEKEDNLLFLFNVLDSIVNLEKSDPGFWGSLFYIDKGAFSPAKTRLFFKGSEVNLLERCLFSYGRNSNDFSFPEQLLLYACIWHWLYKTQDFGRAARIIRNLVANSTNELRLESIGDNFREIEKFVSAKNFDALSHFKTDQIREEKEKEEVIKSQPFIGKHMWELEDSDLFRGSISIFDIDDKFIARKNSFLVLFDEDLVITKFQERANLLLCFGDYTQDDGDHTNVLARSRATWRRFLTTPGYNKQQLYSKTKPVLTECLDYFIANPTVRPEDKINSTLAGYASNSKGWEYYFLKYKGFRDECQQGYYYWGNDGFYPSFKMNARNFNGYHWDPFLLEAKKSIKNSGLKLDNGDKMEFVCGDKIYQIGSDIDGFVIKDASPSDKNLVGVDEVQIRIKQSEEGIDLEDRIERLTAEIHAMLQNAN